MECENCDTEHLAEVIVVAFIQEELANVEPAPLHLPCCYAMAKECEEWMWTLPGVVQVQREPLEEEAA